MEVVQVLVVVVEVVHHIDKNSGFPCKTRTVGNFNEMTDIDIGHHVFRDEWHLE